MRVDTDQRITPADIEGKLRELFPRAEGAGKDALPMAAAVGIVVVAAVVGIAFLLGRRKGRHKSTFVEIKRI